MDHFSAGAVARKLFYQRLSDCQRRGWEAVLTCEVLIQWNISESQIWLCIDSPNIHSWACKCHQLTHTACAMARQGDHFSVSNSLRPSGSGCTTESSIIWNGTLGDQTAATLMRLGWRHPRILSASCYLYRVSNISCWGWLAKALQWFWFLGKHALHLQTRECKKHLRTQTLSQHCPSWNHRDTISTVCRHSLSTSQLLSSELFRERSESSGCPHADSGYVLDMSE